MTPPPAALFDPHDVNLAGKEWGFNCGPGALCLLLNLKPEDVRPHMGDFETKGYTDPELMFSVLRSLGYTWEGLDTEWPEFGLARIQWAGPWTRPGVPKQDRLRHSHWIASWRGQDGMSVGDVNATCVGGWVSFHEWHQLLVPWLLRDVEPEASGHWWPTHRLSLRKP